MTYPSSDIDEMKLKDSDDITIVNWTTAPFSRTPSNGIYEFSFAFFDSASDFTGTYLDGTDEETEALTGTSDKEFIKTAFDAVLTNSDPWGVGFADVANIEFTEQVSGVGDIVILQVTANHYALVAEPNATAGTFRYQTGGSQDYHGDIIVNASYSTWNDDGDDTSDAIVIGEYSWQVIHEEILHALGVDVQTGSLSGTSKDSNQYTVTSYDALDGMEASTNPNVGAYAAGLQLYDIAALHEIYGANMSTRSTATTYKEGKGFGASVNDAFIYTIWDGGGTDTIDASGYADGVTIDLREGHFSHIGKAADTSWNGGRGTGLAMNNVAIAYGAKIENATGTGATDTIHGNDLNNSLRSGINKNLDNGEDTLYGYGGDDTLLGSRGDEHLEGGAGDDIIYTNGGSDKAYGGDGDDTIRVDNYSSTDRPEAYGGNGNDYIEMFSDVFGTNTLVDGGAGDDTYKMIGQGSVEFVDISGNDTYRSNGHFNEHIDYSGNDSYNIVSLRDYEIDDRGGLDALLLWGAIESTSFSTGVSGNDLLLAITYPYNWVSNVRIVDYYVNSSQHLETLKFTDNVEIGFDYIINGHLYTVGTGGDDGNVAGGAGADLIYSFGGNDTLSGGLGDDYMNGGDGIDTVDYSGAASAVTVSLLAGTATGGDGSDTLANIENVIGSAHDDTLVGSAGVNDLSGGDGADTLWGADGDDILRGNAGADWLYGQVGADTLYGGDGDDTLYGDTATPLGTDGDDIIYGEGGNDTISGGGGADTLHGDAGSDSIWGAEGNDILHGGVGADFLYGNGGDDTIHGGDDHDVITGDDGDDTLRGDAGSDSLWGGEGNDILRGGDGNDTLYGDLTTPQGTDGDDTIHGEGGNDTISGGGGADTLYGDAGIDQLYGGGGNDILRGGADADYLYGNDGDDTLYSDGGADLVYGHAGADTFVYEDATAFTGVDAVGDFSVVDGDVLDISDVLDGHYTSGVDAITDFVQITDNSTNSTVAIDQDGTANGMNFVSVAILYGTTGMTNEAALESAGTLVTG